MVWLTDGENGLSSSIKLVEMVTSPGELLGVVVSQVGNGIILVASLLNNSLIASMDIVVEGVFEGNCVALLSPLNLDGEGSNNRLEGSPGVRDKSGGVEKSGSDNVGLEVLLDSALLHLPANDLNVAFSVVLDLNLMESVAVPVVTLGDETVIEIVVDVVVVAEVVGGVKTR